MIETNPNFFYFVAAIAGLSASASSLAVCLPLIYKLKSDLCTLFQTHIGIAEKEKEIINDRLEKLENR